MFIRQKVNSGYICVWKDYEKEFVVYKGCPILHFYKNRVETLTDPPLKIV